MPKNWNQEEASGVQWVMLVRISAINPSDGPGLDFYLPLRGIG